MSTTIDAQKAVQKKYATLPLPRDLIPTSNNSKTHNDNQISGINGTITPHVLWIGCSDSWITETETVDVKSESLFVIRNLGAVVSNGDLSSSSALEYALEVLKIQHIVVCGHYDCRLIKLDNGPEADHGWHRDLSLLHNANEDFLKDSDLSDLERNRRLEECWVLAEVDWLRRNEIVQRAVVERGVELHAICFDKEVGKCLLLVEE